MKEESSKKNQNNALQAFSRFKSYLYRSSSSFRNRIFVFLVFFLLSSVLWFYRTLDDTFVANINYPVKFQNLPKNKILVGELPKKIKLRTRGKGYSLLSNKIKFKTPLNFNINSFLLYSQGTDSMSVYILTRYAQEALTVELSKKNSDLEIVSISPDTLFFSFTRTKNKRVAILPSIVDNGNMYARQYMLNGKITSTPDSVEIIGPASHIDTIKYLYTELIQPNELSDTLFKKVDLLKVDQVRIPIKKVNVSIPVDRFTEISYKVPIRAKEVPDSINMKLFPKEIKLSFNITHSNIPYVSESDFRPFVNYTDIKENTKSPTQRLSVKIDSVPSLINSLRIYPSSVEFINELNYAQSRNNRGDR